MAKHEDVQMTGETAVLVGAIGRRIRQLRSEKDMTLQKLGEKTGLSASMLSLLERGKTGPSIGTLVVIASALEAQMSDLLEFSPRADHHPVSRSTNQKIFQTEGGVLRRILKHDREHGVEIAINEYNIGTANSPEPRGHEGFEYGIVLEGNMTVTIGDEAYDLQPGDLISYDSTRPHRIANTGNSRARALWVNMRKA